MQQAYNNIKVKLSETKVATMQHYLSYWRTYEYIAALSFAYSSALTGAWTGFQWSRHRKFKTQYTAAQYHKMVRNNGRMGLIITSSLIVANNAGILVPHCTRELNKRLSNQT